MSAVTVNHDDIINLFTDKFQSGSRCSKNNLEILRFEKAYHALDEAVKKLESESKQDDMKSMFEEENTPEIERGISR